MTAMRPSREDVLTAWLRRRLARAGQDLIGDDAAFLPDGRSAITIDQQIAGVHFPRDLAPEAVGRRLVAVNASDIAAVGGTPAYGFLALAAPTDYPIKRLLGAVEGALSKVGAVLAGGDMAATPALTATLTLIGHRPPRSRWVRRSGARAGDRLWVGGTLGESALGRTLLEAGARWRSGRVELPAQARASRTIAASARRAVRRHLLPPNQLEVGAWLARRPRAAAIDISDGLLLDLERLCRESGVGAVIDAASLPIADHFDVLADRLGVSATELVLGGGEDYVLLCALPPDIEPPRSLGVVEIGVATGNRRVEVLGATPPRHRGWDHFSAP